MRSNKKILDLRASSKKTSPKSPSLHFRTIFKCRNDSIVPSTPLQHPPNLQKVKSSSRVSCHSESGESHRAKAAAEKGIKDYVRQMKLKKEAVVSPRSEINDKDLNDTRLSRVSNSSKLFNQTTFHENLGVNPKVNILQDLQNRIENLLETKLEKIKQSQAGVGLTNWQFLRKMAQLEPQLDEIMVRLKSNQQTEEGVNQLSAKLELIEKMIASQAIESELMKDRYFGFKNQRCNISSHHNKQLLATSAIYNDRSHLRTHTYRSENKAESLSKYVSTNRQAFSKPPKDFYVSSKYKHPAYAPNRQILPRSSYSTEFLKYGTMPTFKSRPLNSELPSHSLAVKASTYQQQFKDKYNMSSTIDFRELDCYKNKYKNPNISFMNNCKKKAFETVSALKRSAKVCKDPDAADGKLTKLLSQSTIIDFYKTQQTRNYAGHSASQSQLASWMRGEPKNGQLINLKESLRASYLRG